MKFPEKINGLANSVYTSALYVGANPRSVEFKKP